MHLIHKYVDMQGVNFDSVEQREIAVSVGQDFEACTVEVFSTDVRIFPANFII